MPSNRRVNTALIRQLNLARIFHALRVRPGASQRELSVATGIDRATVSAVVAQLERDGLIARSSKSVEGRVGRPEIALRISEDAGLLVGARMEPAAVRLMAASPAGTPVRTLQVAGSTDPAVAIDRLIAGVEALVADCGRSMDAVLGIGVGIPALMESSGRLAFAPNLGWRDVEIRKPLADRWSTPIYVDNDTKAGGLAEKLFGSCQDVDDFVFIAGHSGVGAALYLDGRLYRGASGYAGELGHVKIRPDGRDCACGRTGCLEAYLSESALLARLAERGASFEDVRAAAAAAESGEAVVLEVLVESGVMLGEAASDLVNLLNPARIVLGGNMALVAPFMIDGMESVLAERSLGPPQDACEVVLSPLGIESVTMGGVALAMEGFLSLPGWLAASELGGILS